MKIEEFKENTLYAITPQQSIPTYFFVVEASKNYIRYMSFKHQMGDIWYVYKNTETDQLFGLLNISLSHKVNVLEDFHHVIKIVMSPTTVYKS